MLRYLRRYKKAREITRLSQAAKENPGDLRMRIKLADMYLKHGDLDTAVAEYVSVADEYITQDFSVHALALYKKASRLAPSCVHVHEKLALTYVKNGHTTDGLIHYKMLIDIHATNGEAGKVDQVVEEMLLLTVEVPDFIMNISDSDVMTEGLTKIRKNCLSI